MMVWLQNPGKSNCSPALQHCVFHEIFLVTRVDCEPGVSVTSVERAAHLDLPSAGPRRGTEPLGGEPADVLAESGASTLPPGRVHVLPPSLSSVFFCHQYFTTRVLSCLRRPSHLLLRSVETDSHSPLIPAGSAAKSPKGTTPLLKARPEPEVQEVEENLYFQEHPRLVLLSTHTQTTQQLSDTHTHTHS